MKFNIKKVELSKKRELDSYIPLEVPRQLTAVDPIVGDNAISGNSTAYRYLKELFMVAPNLRSQEIIYIPAYPIIFNEYRDIWSYGIFGMDIVLVNYHST